MPKLEYLMKNINGVQADLDEADDVKSNMDSMLEKRFANINKTIEASLKDLIRQSGDGQSAAFSQAVQQAMLSLTQTQTILLQSLAQLSSDGKKQTEQICADIDSVATQSTKNTSGISKEINDAKADITKTIKAIPVPKPTDLRGLSKDIKSLEGVIKSIPKTVIPEQIDISGDLKALKDIIKNRTHVFEVEREQFGDKLIKTITATSK
jgi:ABC-type transporter Mla subunit MlaD